MGQAALQTSQIKNSCANVQKILKQMAYQVIFGNIKKFKNCL